MRYTIVFLGRFDDSLKKLENDVINMAKDSEKDHFTEQSGPDVIKFSYKKHAFDIWVISGNVKPTLLLKNLIKEANLLILTFNLKEKDTFTFLTEGWGPIIDKAGEIEQERNLVGILPEPSQKDDKSKIPYDDIKQTMENFNCSQYYEYGKHREHLKNLPVEISEDLISDIKNKVFDNSLIFLGQYNEEQLSFENDVINMENKSNNIIFDPKSLEPGFVRFPINNSNFNAWSLVDIKPNKDLKDVIEEMKIIIFTFDLSNLDTLTFLKEKWLPIIKTVKKKNQKRILVGIFPSSSKSTNYKLREAYIEANELIEEFQCTKYFEYGKPPKSLQRPKSCIINNNDELIRHIKQQIKRIENNYTEEEEEEEEQDLIYIGEEWEYLEIPDISIGILGQFDKEQIILENDLINMKTNSNAEIVNPELTPGIHPFPINGFESKANIFIVNDEPKPQLKDFLNKMKIIIFTFDLSKPDTLTFLEDKWSKIITKVKKKNQKRILVGIFPKSSKSTDYKLRETYIKAKRLIDKFQCTKYFEYGELPESLQRPKSCKITNNDELIPHIKHQIENNVTEEKEEEQIHIGEEWEDLEIPDIPISILGQFDKEQIIFENDLINMKENSKAKTVNSELNTGIHPFLIKGYDESKASIFVVNDEPKPQIKDFLNKMKIIIFTFNLKQTKSLTFLKEEWLPIIEELEQNEQERILVGIFPKSSKSTDYELKTIYSNVMTIQEKLQCSYYFEYGQPPKSLKSPSNIKVDIYDELFPYIQQQLSPIEEEEEEEEEKTEVEENDSHKEQNKEEKDQLNQAQSTEITQSDKTISKGVNLIEADNVSKQIVEKEEDKNKTITNNEEKKQNAINENKEENEMEENYEISDNSISILGQFDKEQILLENDLIYMQKNSKTHIVHSKLTPGVHQFPIEGYESKANIFVVNDKPKSQMKNLLSKMKIIIFTFNLKQTKSLTFLEEEWLPIIEQFDKNNQERILVGIFPKPSKSTKLKDYKLTTIYQKVKTIQEKLQFNKYFEYGQPPKSLTRPKNGIKINKELHQYIKDQLPPIENEEEFLEEEAEAEENDSHKGQNKEENDQPNHIQNIEITQSDKTIHKLENIIEKRENEEDKNKQSLIEKEKEQDAVVVNKEENEKKENVVDEKGEEENYEITDNSISILGQFDKEQIILENDLINMKKDSETEKVKSELRPGIHQFPIEGYESKANIFILNDEPKPQMKNLLSKMKIIIFTFNLKKTKSLTFLEEEWLPIIEQFDKKDQERILVGIFPKTPKSSDYKLTTIYQKVKTIKEKLQFSKYFEYGKPPKSLTRPSKIGFTINKELHQYIQNQLSPIENEEVNEEEETIDESKKPNTEDQDNKHEEGDSNVKKEEIPNDEDGNVKSDAENKEGNLIKADDENVQAAVEKGENQEEDKNKQFKIEIEKEQNAVVVNEEENEKKENVVDEKGEEENYEITDNSISILGQFDKEQIILENDLINMKKDSETEAVKSELRSGIHQFPIEGYESKANIFVVNDEPKPQMKNLLSKMKIIIFTFNLKQTKSLTFLEEKWLPIIEQFDKKDQERILVGIFPKPSKSTKLKDYKLTTIYQKVKTIQEKLQFSKYFEYGQPPNSLNRPSSIEIKINKELHQYIQKQLPPIENEEGKETNDSVNDQINVVNDDNKHNSGNDHETGNSTSNENINESTSSEKGKNDEDKLGIKNTNDKKYDDNITDNEDEEGKDEDKNVEKTEEDEEIFNIEEDKGENPDEDLTITENGVIYNLSKKDKKAEIFQSLDENKKIEIPRFIEHKSKLYKIVQINSEAFLKSTIEVFKMINDENITILEKSFEDCVSLRSIIIETKETIHIEENNFNKILKLESIYIKGKHIIIDSNCFTKCFAQEQYLAQQQQPENKIIIIEGTNQISIGNACFKQNDLLEQIELKSKQITVGDDCFDECRYLSSLTISESNEFSLGKNQFRKCLNLQKLMLKSAKIDLGIRCFSLSSLTEVDIFGEEITINKFSVSDLLSITKFSINKSKIVVIDENAFAGCKNLKIFSVVSEQSINVSNSCFINLESLQEIFIACPTIFIDKSCFMNCKSLSSIKFDRVTEFEISNQAFSGCESLKELSINSYQKIQIKERCFSGCKNLSSIKLSSEEIIIDEFCFENCFSVKNECSSLLSLTFSEVRILDIKSNSFKNCVNLAKITIERSEVVHFGQLCFNKASKLSSIDINTDQLIIDENCFYQCESLRSLIFDKVKNAVFNPCSFKECSNLQTISVKNACLLNFGETCFIDNKNISSIDIQSDEIKFNNKFINSCPYLTKIKLSSVQNIAITQDTFPECTSLSNIEINSENSLDLNAECFNNSKNLNQIKFKSNKININTDCFSYATNLQYVTIDCSELTIGEKSFKSCPKLSSIALINIQNLLIRKNAISGYSKLTNITFKAQKSINLGDSCFFAAMNLEYITLDSEEVEIHKNCFKACKNLTSITFKNVHKASIGSNSFDQCQKLRIIDISTTSSIKLNNYCFCEANNLDSVTLSSKEIEIGKYCFKKCKYLSNIQLHYADDLTIGCDAFAECESLQNLKLTVKSKLKICDYCFSGANNLKSVIISGNFLFIGDFIFKDCPSLISAEFKSSSKSQLSDKAFYNSPKALKLDLSKLIK